jgi:hypothetical protein
MIAAFAAALVALTPTPLQPRQRASAGTAWANIASALTPARKAARLTTERERWDSDRRAVMNERFLENDVESAVRSWSNAA